MQDRAASDRVELRFIQPGKPGQNACIESVNSRFRDKLPVYVFCIVDNWRHCATRSSDYDSPPGL
jgi:hypothetical protein